MISAVISESTTWILSPEAWAALQIYARSEDLEEIDCETSGAGITLKVRGPPPRRLADSVRRLRALAALRRAR